MKTDTSPLPILQWDIFCRVIDNHGDLGVCWRLCADLAQRGHAVRLWVDDASALAWMAPQGCAGVDVSTWPNDAALYTLAQDPAFKVGDVVIEAFGCTLPEAFQALMTHRKPVWINLEYLSAEAYVAHSHGLASPVMSGPAKGMTKWFYYPGFTSDTGGLLREPNLLEGAFSNDRVQRSSTNHTTITHTGSAASPSRQALFDRAAWLNTLPLDTPIAAQERLVSLFCYEPKALPDLLRQLSQGHTPTRLLVAQGRPNAAVAAALLAINLTALSQENVVGKGRCHIDDQGNTGTDSHSGNQIFGQLHISQLPYLSQTDFDHLLWSCDLNFVRGEDSVVRALWAGKPFVWHIYPQEDLAHHDKLQAFYECLQMPPSLRRLHDVWNGRCQAALPAWTASDLVGWQDWIGQTRPHLQSRNDLSTQLIGFVAQKR